MISIIRENFLKKSPGENAKQRRSQPGSRHLCRRDNDASGCHGPVTSADRDRDKSSDANDGYSNKDIGLLLVWRVWLGENVENERGAAQSGKPINGAAHHTRHGRRHDPARPCITPPDQLNQSGPNDEKTNDADYQGWVQ